MKKPIKNALISITTCLAFAIIGNLFTGDALESWFAQLRQPAFALPLWGWMIVGGLYYIMAIIIFYRVLQLPGSSGRTSALWLTLAMIAGNEFWNYLFFGLQSTLAGFIGLLPFCLLAMVLYLKLRKVQASTAWILLPYLLWLGYDLVWAYSLWQLNT